MSKPAFSPVDAGFFHAPIRQIEDSPEVVPSLGRIAPFGCPLPDS
jgi:hypothetical protein